MIESNGATDAQVWIGCLACYGEGRLVGEWFDALGADGVGTLDIHRGITPGTQSSRRIETTHEEMWVFDHEGLPITGECSPTEATEWARVLDDVEPGHREALGAWVQSGDYIALGTGQLPSLTDFKDRFAGQWESFREYAEQLADDCALLADGPDELVRYFDWDAWTRDLAYDYTTETSSSGGVFVFRSL